MKKIITFAFVAQAVFCTQSAFGAIVTFDFEGLLLGEPTGIFADPINSNGSKVDGSFTFTDLPLPDRAPFGTSIDAFSISSFRPLPAQASDLSQFGSSLRLPNSQLVQGSIDNIDRETENDSVEFSVLDNGVTQRFVYTLINREEINGRLVFADRFIFSIQSLPGVVPPTLFGPSNPGLNNTLDRAYEVIGMIDPSQWDAEGFYSSVTLAPGEVDPVLSSISFEITNFAVRQVPTPATFVLLGIGLFWLSITASTRRKKLSC